MLKFDKLLLEHALIRPCTIAQAVLVSLLKFNCEGQYKKGTEDRGPRTGDPGTKKLT